MNSSKDKEEENEQNEISYTQINLINLTPSISLFNTHRHRHGRNQQVNKKERKNYQFFFPFLYRRHCTYINSYIPCYNKPNKVMRENKEGEGEKEIKGTNKKRILILTNYQS
jgi:hypothetical protein